MNTQSAILSKESSIADFIALLKPRVMSLVVFTACVGMYLAPGNIHPFIAIISILCVAFGSGAAGAINMWYERETDALMNRTKNRPLPSGRIDSGTAIEFSVIIALASVLIMALVANLMAAFLLLTAILFYVFIYTIWLKPRTPQNIVIGGAAGAFPPMIGWAVVTGSITAESILLFTIIFLWTPPHFWSLALYKNDDYTKAGIPMLPVISGARETQKQILIYTLILVACSIVPFFTGMFGYIYLSVALILGTKFTYNALALYKKYSEDLARHNFKFSMLYLFLLFLSMIIDKMV